MDATHGYITDKSKYLARLKRIEGQARGIHRMIDEEQYCIDILTQISALTKALKEPRSPSSTITSSTAWSTQPSSAVMGRTSKIKEASDAIARLVRS